MKAMGLGNAQVLGGGGGGGGAGATAPVRGGHMATLADHALADPDIDAKVISGTWWHVVARGDTYLPTAPICSNYA